MPAAFAPLPATLFAVLVLPPSVPKSVTVNIGWPLARRRVQTRTATTVKQSLVFVLIGGCGCRGKPGLSKNALADKAQSEKIQPVGRRRLGPLFTEAEFAGLKA
jgi:hypothetical protein